MERKAALKTVAVLILAAGLTMVASVSPARAQTFTLESILSAPFPSDLIASPRGDATAWTFYDQGKRNVWVALAPDFKAHPLTRFDQDDGQEISSLVFSHDGSVIVFVRGQGLNRSGEYPNPSSSPSGAEQAVWAVKTVGGDPWRIGQGSDPVPSPVELKVVHSLRGSLIMSSLEGPTAPQSLFKARGAATMFSFSPDGSRLVFASSRGDHSFIGIYDLKAKSLSWVDPSADRDYFPAWSPDGAKLAFIRFPGSKAEPEDWDESSAFSIMIADAVSGAAREAWRSPNPTGGFAQSYFEPPLFWAANGRLVFYSEHEGWMHLYALDTAGGKILCLSPGAYEVEGACLTKDLKNLIFNSNQGDIDRRHLWIVPVAGGTPQILTPGQGLEWSPAALSSGNHVAFLCSTSRETASLALLSLPGKERRPIAPELVPASFPTKDLVAPQQVVFRAPDGLEIHGQLFLPKGIKPGERKPAVIFMHGGPIRQMLLGWHMRHYYHNAYAFNQFLASRGTVVLSVNYRAGIGYGRAFREAPRTGPKGASEYQDIVSAANYLQRRPDVDHMKIGLWGGSYGGYLTALGLARDSALFAAGVDLHGVHDWSTYIRQFSMSSATARAADAERLAWSSSPVASLDFWTSPVLFIHGDDDRNVDFSQTTDVVQRLRALGKAHMEILVFPDEVHDFLRHANWLRAYHTAFDFLDKWIMK